MRREKGIWEGKWEAKVAVCKETKVEGQKEEMEDWEREKDNTKKLE
jgi:hypothetical protein